MTEPHPPTSPSTRRLGPYSLHSEIGRGGMGVVYRAWDGVARRWVAVKLLLAGTYSAEEQVERFLREGRNASRVAHPNVVAVRDVGWHEGQVYLVMDLVRGENLERHLQGAPLPATRALEICAGVAEGLHAAHLLGLAHRDIKPGNILVDERGVPRIVDFGLAVERGDPTLTRAGQVLGTPQYMPPERATGRRDADGALSDQYSLGAVLYALLAASPPYGDNDAVTTLMAVAQGPPTAIAALAPGLPRDVYTVVQKAMERHPKDRYPTTKALAEDLRRAATGEPIAAQAPALFTQLRRMVQANREPIGWAVTGALGLLVVGLLGLGGSRYIESERLAARETAAVASVDRLLPQLEELVRNGDWEEAAIRAEREVARPDLRGTNASSRLALAFGEITLQYGDFTRAAPLLAQAFQESAGREDQERALRGLAQCFAAERNAPSLAAVIGLLERRFGPQNLNPLRETLALSLGDPAAAVAAGTSDWSELLLPLTTGRPIELGPHPASFLARGRWWATDWDWGNTAIDILSGEALPITEPGRLKRVAGSERVVIHREGANTLGLMDVIDGEVRQLVDAEWEDSAPLAALTMGDDTYVGSGPYRRQLTRLRGPDFQPEQPLPGVDAMKSDVHAIAESGDDLAIALGPWRAYSIRVYREGESGIELKARRQLGTVVGLMPSPRGWPGEWIALKSNAYPNLRVFPAAQPSGEPAGLYVLDQNLNTVEHFPTGSEHPTHLEVADLNGDGRDELLISDTGSLEIVRRTNAKAESLILSGWSAQRALNLDDDPADELLVTVHHRPVVVGMDGPALPSMQPTHPELLPAPARLPPELASRWNRLETLVGIGRLDAASAGLEGMAPTLPDDLSAAAYHRSAELSAASGDHPRALRLYSKAAGAAPRESRRRTEALHMAAEVAKKLHRFAEEGQLLAELGEQSLPADPRERPASLSGAELTIVDPLSATRDQTNLSIVAASGGPPVAQREFRYHGDHLVLEVELDFSRVEWSSGLTIELQGPKGAVVTMSSRGWGGGGFIDHQLSCVGGATAAWTAQSSEPMLPDSAPVRMVFDYAERTGTARCELRRGSTLLAWNEAPMDAPEPGSYHLVVHPSDHAGQSVAQNAVWRGTLRSLRFTDHLTPLEPEPDAKGSPLFRGLDLARRGAWDQAVAATVSHADPADRARTLRLHPGFGAMLREADPDALPKAIEQAWSTAAHHHPGDEEVRNALEQQLVGVAATTPAAVRMLRLNGAAALQRGELTAAGRDLALAHRGASILGLANEAEATSVERAALASRAGDPVLAARLIEETIAESATPQLILDAVSFRSDFAALRAHPDWKPTAKE